MSRRVRDEVGVDAGDPIAGEPAMTGARQAIADAHERRDNHDLWLAREALRILGEEKQRLSDRVAELEQALGVMQQICEANVALEEDVARLNRYLEVFDSDLAASVERLQTRASDILLDGGAGAPAPSAPLLAVAEASTALADSLIAYARERRLAERSSRPRRSSAPPTGQNSEGEH